MWVASQCSTSSPKSTRCPLQPLVVRATAGDIGLEFFVGDQTSLFEIDEEHLARLQAALDLDVVGIDVEHAHFAGHDDLVVVGDVVAAGTQPVPVQTGSDEVSVGEGDARRSVPRLLQGGVELVEGAFVFGHVVMILPRLGNHHHGHFLERPSGVVQELHGVVEVAGVTAVLLDDREELLQIIAEQVRLHRPLASVHPVGVPLDGVDLAVVSHEPARLGAIPGGEGVGGEPAVHHRQVRLEVLVLQVGEVGHDLRGGQHPLVDDDLGRQRAGVEFETVRMAALADAVTGHLADHEQLTFQRVLIKAVGRTDEQHFHPRFGIAGGRADIRGIGSLRDLAPAEQLLALGGDQLINDPLELLACRIVLREEDQPGPVLALLGQGNAEFVLRDLAEEAVGQGGEHAGTVTGIFLASAGTAMRHVPQDAVGIGARSGARPAP